MSNDLPIACSLTAGDLSARLDEIGAVGRAALLGVERTAGGAVLRFRPGTDTAERLAAIIAAEARCCAFLDMTLRDAGDALVLAIEAPADARPVLDDLVVAFGYSSGYGTGDRSPAGVTRPQPL
jgi:hypothetical protein